MQLASRETLKTPGILGTTNAWQVAQQLRPLRVPPTNDAIVCASVGQSLGSDEVEEGSWSAENPIILVSRARFITGIVMLALLFLLPTLFVMSTGIGALPAKRSRTSISPSASTMVSRQYQTLALTRWVKGEAAPIAKIYGDNVQVELYAAKFTKSATANYSLALFNRCSKLAIDIRRLSTAPIAPNGFIAADVVSMDAEFTMESLGCTFGISQHNYDYLITAVRSAEEGIKSYGRLQTELARSAVQ